MSELTGAAETLGALIVFCALPMLHPKTRRTAFALMVFAKRHAPRWLVPVLAVCAFIPGLLDELLVLAAVAYPVLRSRRNRRLIVRYITYSWKGSSK